MQYRKPDPCHSEARFTGEESASCPQQNSRFLAQNAALWNDNSFGLFRSQRAGNRTIAMSRAYNQAIRPAPAGKPWSFCVSLLPLFPLDLVLFPGTPLPLHIFEPRYREMISECLDQKKSFGVVRAKEEGVAEIGCTAEIITVTQKYPDGRMDIVTEGRERFEVMQVNQERSFLQADVLYLQDEPDQASAEEIAQALKLQGEIFALAGSSSTSPSAIESAQLSFNLVAPHAARSRFQADPAGTEVRS